MWLSESRLVSQEKTQTMKNAPNSPLRRVRRSATTGLGLLIAVVLTRMASAGIPEPPAVLHGQVVLDGQQVHDSDDVTILARSSDVSLPIGTYRMGDIAAAGDNYVLKIRIESLMDGQTQSDNAALVGQTADLFVRVSDGPERPAGQFDLLAWGLVENRDLIVETTFGTCADEDGDIDMDDLAAFVACGTNVNGEVSLECGCADANGDGDSDLADWAEFQNGFTGPL